MIETAKAQMDSESIRFEDVLTQLEEKRQRLEKDQTEAERLRSQRETDSWSLSPFTVVTTACFRVPPSSTRSPSRMGRCRWSGSWTTPPWGS